MSDPDETINQPINLTINMASVQDDGYTFQTKTLTNLPTEMLTHILENASLKDALSFGQTNRDAFDVVSETQILQIALALRNSSQNLIHNFLFRGYVNPVIPFFQAPKNFVETKRKITYAVASSMTGLISFPLVQMAHTPCQMDSL